MNTNLRVPHFCECGHTMQTCLKVWVTPGVDVIEQDDIDWESYGGEWSSVDGCECIIPSWRIVQEGDSYSLQHYAWNGTVSEWITDSNHAAESNARITLAALVEREMPYRCDNCEKGFLDETKFKTLAEVDSLYERLDPGSIVPHGECPECGAFVYKAEQPAE